MAEENDQSKFRLPGLYGNTDLNSRINMFQEQAEKHKEKQKLNPYIDNYEQFY